MLAKWSWSLVLCSLGLFAQADVESLNKARQVDQDIEQQEVPSEEFWLFMAEFSDDEQSIDPEDLAVLVPDKSSGLTTTSQSSEQEALSAASGGESL